MKRLILLLLCLLVGACSSNQEAAIETPVVANTPNPVAQASDPSPTIIPSPTETPVLPSATATPTLPPSATPTSPIVVTATPNAAAGASPTATPIEPEKAPMVVVPAGEFLMGSTIENVATWNQKFIDLWFKNPSTTYPSHIFVGELYEFKGYLEQFEIDQFEVTNYQYRKCVEAEACSPPKQKEYYAEPAYGNYPVMVSWQKARAYCQWVEKRLPSEAEWEKAARGNDGRIYPWGNEWDSTRLNSSRKLLAVGSFPMGSSPLGAQDMVGNAEEWTSDDYALYPGRTPPEGATEWGPVIRGGVNVLLSAPEIQFRTAVRNNGLKIFLSGRNEEGFRCVRGAVQELVIVEQVVPTPLPTPSTVELSNIVLIPAGEFMMGTDDLDASYRQSNTPAHLVTLDEFVMDRYEVTNEQFSTFLNLLGQHKWACQEQDCIDLSPRSVRDSGVEIEFATASYAPFAGRENVPVVATWYGAFSYCQWQGKRLPTEAEWEKAARGTDERKYPWGNEKYQWDEIGRRRPSSQVGSHPHDSSPFGVFDMSGNALEWVADWYDENYYTYSPANNPLGPEEPPSERERVVRGVSRDRGITVRDRSGPLGHTGFRCAYSP